MGYNAIQTCDLSTDQKIGGKKTFLNEVVATSFRLEEGGSLEKTAVTEIVNNAKNRLLISCGNTIVEAHPRLTFSNTVFSVQGTVAANYISGDGSKIENISFENIEGSLPLAKLDLDSSLIDKNNKLSVNLAPNSGLELTEEGLSLHMGSLDTTTVANRSDEVLVYQRGKNNHFSRMGIRSLFSLIPLHNGVLYDFINEAKNVGSGLKLLKNKINSPRICTLNFKTIQLGEGLTGSETENEIHIGLDSTSFVAPEVDIELVNTPVNGLLVYNSTDHRLYTYAKDRWIALHRA